MADSAQLLEQLIGSQSLGGTLERAVKLRRYNLIGIAVILLWLLSPLGGQSSLRILDIENRDVISSTQITYYNATARPQTSVLAGEGSSFADLKIVASLFQATLLESNRSRTSPVDLWNNVKIPRLRQLSPFTEAALDNEWISIDNNANIAWSSLTGLLIKGLPLDGISTFVISSTYLDLACSDDTPVTSLDDLANISTGTAVNLTNGAWNFETYSNYLTTEEVVTSSYMGESLSSDGHLPLSLTYVSDVSTLANSPTANSNAVDVYNCSLDLATVESNTTCHGDSCTVTSMKRSPDPSHSMPFSSLEYGQLLNDLCLLGGLVNGGKATAGGHCATDYYLLGETSPLSYVTQEDPPLPNFPSIKGPVFAERLTTLLNTAWQISLAPINLPLGSSANFSQITPDGGTGATDTTATVARQVPHYSTNMLYITLLLVVTFVLQACAIVGLILKYMTIAPDILGYVSTMTRDNPHTKIGVGGNTLDGLERARLLHSMKVQLADSTKDQAEGHVVFRSVDPEDEYAKKELDKRRLYF